MRFFIENNRKAAKCIEDNIALHKNFTKESSTAYHGCDQRNQQSGGKIIHLILFLWTRHTGRT